MSLPPVAQVIEVTQVQRGINGPGRQDKAAAQGSSDRYSSCLAGITCCLAIIITCDDQHSLGVAALQVAASLQQVACIHRAGDGVASFSMQRGASCPAFAQVERLAG